MKVELYWKVERIERIIPGLVNIKSIIKYLHQVVSHLGMKYPNQLVSTYHYNDTNVSEIAENKVINQKGYCYFFRIKNVN